MESIYIALTAHNPLSRVETTLKVLKGYETLPLTCDVEIFIDFDHKGDLDEFSLIVGSHIHLNTVSFTIASPEYEGYYLCWAHKDSLKNKVDIKAFDYYMYSENDMLFCAEHFDYWVRYKDKLKRLNLEPGFCRFERVGDKKIPFDNYRKWNLLGPTEKCWGDVPHKGQFVLAPTDGEVVGFVSLGNPYGGLMILDQEQADKYITSDSCDPHKSYFLTGKRNWPIADRSSMGLAFEDLLPEQEHRRVVPVVRYKDKLRIPDYALVEHMDLKYSPALLKKEGIIDTDSMFAY